jgi:transporter family protein
MSQIGWLQLSLIALILWGLWSFLGKIALENLDWKSVFVFAGVAQIFVIAIFYGATRPPMAFDMKTCYAMIVGILGVSATMAFYYALEQGRASIVVPLTATYPLVTVILAAVLLRERLSINQGAGVLLAILAIVLISTE